MAHMEAAIAIGNKYATQRIYGVEGLAPSVSVLKLVESYESIVISRKVA